MIKTILLYFCDRNVAVDLIARFNASIVTTTAPEKLAVFKANITGALTVLNNTLDRTRYSLVPEKAADVNACELFSPFLFV